MSEAVCIGICVADLLFAYVDEELLNRDVTLAEQFLYAPGGDALNEATRLAMLGHSVCLMGRIGNDVFGSFLIEELERRGIDAEELRVDPERATTVTAVLIKRDGQRAFVSTRGASKFCGRDCINFDKIKTAGAVSIASAFHAHQLDACAEEILSLAKRSGAMTFMDFIGTVDGGDLGELRSAFPYLDYAMPNLEEAQILTGRTLLPDIAEAFLDLGVLNLIVKLGAEGCFYANRREQRIVPSFHVTCVDTTGAGDSFAGGFIAAKLDGKADIDALRFANASGALAVESYGAQARFGSVEVENLLSRSAL